MRRLQSLFQGRGGCYFSFFLTLFPLKFSTENIVNLSDHLSGEDLHLLRRLSTTPSGICLRNAQKILCSGHPSFERRGNLIYSISDIFKLVPLVAYILPQVWRCVK